MPESVSIKQPQRVTTTQQTTTPQPKLQILISPGRTNNLRVPLVACPPVLKSDGLPILFTLLCYCRLLLLTNGLNRPSVVRHWWASHQWHPANVPTHPRYEGSLHGTQRTRRLC
jgi:hypothetical protein